MPYIYKITNDLNGKIYIGKTVRSISKRFQEHCRDAFKDNAVNRPLYKAMKKYGIKHFKVEEIEECEERLLSAREIYWIKFYNSCKSGYNATEGGEGKRQANYDLIISLFNKGLNVKQTAEQSGYCEDTCRLALLISNISHKEIVQHGRNVIKKFVCQIDKQTNEIIRIFPSIQAAYDSLGKQHSGHIADVCDNKRKTAYGYKRKYMHPCTYNDLANNLSAMHGKC